MLLPKKSFFLFIGPAAAGKTCILWQLVEHEFLEDPAPTLGAKIYEFGDKYMCDVGGQEQFKKEWARHLEAEPIETFFVVDSTRDDHFTEYQDFVNHHPALEFILLANQIDKLALGEKDPIFKQRFGKVKQQTIPCSAKTREGFWDIEEIIYSKSEKIDSEEQVTEPDEQQFNEQQIKQASRQFQELWKKRKAQKDKQ